MKFDYHEVIKLGFERTDLGDNVFFAQNGYDWFTVQLTIKHFQFDWDSTTHEINLIRYDGCLEKDISVKRLATVKIISMEMLKFFIDFLSSTENKIYVFPTIEEKLIYDNYA